MEYIKPNEKIKFNIFSNLDGKYMTFGTYILFQDYFDKSIKDLGRCFVIGKPKLVIYLSVDAVDQAIGFNYVEWFNDRKDKNLNRIPEVHSHYEWSDFINILGVWDHRPTFNEILTAYRQYNKLSLVRHDDMECPK